MNSRIIQRSRRGRAAVWLVIASAVAAGLGRAALAVTDNPTTGAPWNIKTTKGPDAQVGGWFINLGPTGLRAKLLRDRPTVLEIKYVFAGSPADKKIRVGDRVIGANGQPFVTPHKFGYGVDVFGGEGPLMDFANALIHSQSTGKLTLAIERDGKKMPVELTIKKQLPFSRTFPFHCKRSDEIFKRLCAYIAQRQGGNGLWSGRPHINAFATLALLGSGEARYLPNVQRAVHAMAQATSDDPIHDRGGLPCWRYGLYGITLSEYYLATGRKWVLPELEQINQWLRGAQAPRGGWGHSPWVEGGSNGYGPINVITGQAMAAWSLMARCGISVDEQRYRRAYDFIDRGTNSFGYVWYKDGGKSNGRWADMGRTGIAAVALFTCPFGGKAYLERAKLHARCIGTHPQTFPDTHGSPLLGMAWSALGANLDGDNLRRLLDYNRWWIALAECEDGTYVYQPNRDNNPQDYTAAPRLSASAAMALIFAIKEGRLAMMGAQTAVPGLNEKKLSPATRPAFDAIKHHQYARAYRLLGQLKDETTLTDDDRQIIAELAGYLLAQVDQATAPIVAADRVGDVTRVQDQITATQKLYRGIERYDTLVAPLLAKLRQPAMRREVVLGREYARLLARAEQTHNIGDIRALESFVRRCPKSVYAKAARVALKNLQTDDQAADLRDAYFKQLAEQLTGSR